MKAVILAAGIGSRMYPITKSIPKCLIKINKKRIINYQIDILLDNNIDEIIVVVGYLKDKIKECLGNTVIYIENPIYRDSNSSYSLWLTRELFDDSFIYLNSDLVFSKAIFKKLLDNEYGNAIMIDRKINPESDMFKAYMQGNLIIKMDKKLNKSNAEAPGPVKFSKDGAKKIYKKLEEYILQGDKSKWCYTIFSEVAREINLIGIDVVGFPWIEIDTIEDLVKAKKINFD